MTNFIKAIFTFLGGIGIFILSAITLVLLVTLGYIGILVALTIAGIIFIKMLYDAIDENAV